MTVTSGGGTSGRGGGGVVLASLDSFPFCILSMISIDSPICTVLTCGEFFSAKYCRFLLESCWSASKVSVVIELAIVLVS
jgi:hypothetical protein